MSEIIPFDEKKMTSFMGISLESNQNITYINKLFKKDTYFKDYMNLIVENTIQISIENNEEEKKLRLNNSRYLIYMIYLVLIRPNDPNYQINYQVNITESQLEYFVDVLFKLNNYDFLKDEFYNYLAKHSIYQIIFLGKLFNKIRFDQMYTKCWLIEDNIIFNYTSIEDFNHDIYKSNINEIEVSNSNPKISNKKEFIEYNITNEPYFNDDSNIIKFIKLLIIKLSYNPVILENLQKKFIPRLFILEEHIFKIIHILSSEIQISLKEKLIWILLYLNEKHLETAQNLLKKN